MDTKEYYSKHYPGIKNPCPSFIDPKLLKKYLFPEVLDIGCGKGKLALELGKEMPVFGCDVYPEVKKLGKNFFVHDMEKSPTKKKFGSAYCFHVLEHVFDYVSFLQNINKSLKENAVFFLAVPNSYSLASRIKVLFGDETATIGTGEAGCVEKNRLEPHIHFFGKKSLEKILEKNGFRVIEVFGLSSGKKTILGTLSGQLNFVCKKK